MGRASLAVALAILTAGAGCGQNPAASDRASVTRAVRGYLEAEAAGGARVCDFLTTEGRRSRARLNQPAQIPNGGCGPVPGFAEDKESKSELAKASKAPVRVDSLAGDRARASAKIESERFQVALRRSGDEWLISDLDESGKLRRAQEEFLRITRKVERTTNTARRLDCRGFRFDSQRWKRARDDQGEPPTDRQRLADAAIKCRALEGLDQDRALALLGRPDDFVAERGERSWRTGDERNVFAIDSEHLVVRLRGGSVTRAELKTD